MVECLCSVDPLLHLFRGGSTRIDGFPPDLTEFTSISRLRLSTVGDFVLQSKLKVAVKEVALKLMSVSDSSTPGQRTPYCFLLSTMSPWRSSIG